MIRIDQTRHTCLVHCTSCSWRELTVNRALAAARGAIHTRSAHPADDKARKAAERTVSATRRVQ